MHLDTQKRLVRNWLTSGKTITQAQAATPHFNNCWRLSEIIRRLRNDGFDIITDMVDNVNNSGKHAVYKLPVKLEPIFGLHEGKLTDLEEAKKQAYERSLMTSKKVYLYREADHYIINTHGVLLKGRELVCSY